MLTSPQFDVLAPNTSISGYLSGGPAAGAQYTASNTQFELGDTGPVYYIVIYIRQVDPTAPSLYGVIAPGTFSYTPSNPPSNSIAPPPSDPLPITSKMEYENVIPDTNLDDIVQVDHDQTSFGNDTGSISFEAQRDLPQVYVPLNTDGLDSSSDGLPVHAYLVQGGFGTSSNAIGDLGTNAWTYADVNENGQPYAYSLDTRVDIDFVIDDANNHVKRIEVVRPRGNTVVFDFAWDDETQSFSATGYPVGINAGRLYVLRALSPQDDSSLDYQLLFPSGIVQTFGGTTGGLQSGRRCQQRIGAQSVADGALVTDDVTTSTMRPTPGWQAIRSLPRIQAGMR